MVKKADTVVSKAVKSHGKDAGCLLDIIRDVQAESGCVSEDAILQIASQLGISSVDVEGVVTFYHFFSKKQLGRFPDDREILEKIPVRT